MDRTQKEELVADMHQTFSGAAVVVVTHYTGLSVAEISELRAKMREQGARFKVTKNRLTRLALDGTPYQGLTDLFFGPTAIAYSDDPVAAPKVAADYAKSNPKLVLLGGGLGDKVLDANGVKTLATLPSLDEIRGTLVGLLNAPATKVAGVLQAPAGQLARVLAAHAEQQPAE